MATANSSPMHHESRRFAIRVPHWGWFLVVAVVFIVAAGGVGLGFPIYRHHVAVQEIERLGGKVETRKGGPDWLRQLLGDELMKYFDMDRSVNLEGTAFGDAHVMELGWLNGVESLDLNSSQVTDAGLSNLKRFKGLRHLVHLDLRNLPITDRTLAVLGEMTSLESINLGSVQNNYGKWAGGRQITDAGLVHLKRLTNLLNLDLNGTLVTDAGLEHLAPLTRLTHLWLATTPVTDKGISHLKKLTKLEVLCIRGSRVTDVGFVELKRTSPKLFIME